jgi:hypothetical protein
MRQARIKFPAAESEAAYHFVSRPVNGEWPFDDAAKEILRRQLWQVADYCGNVFDRRTLWVSGNAPPGREVRGTVGLSF